MTSATTMCHIHNPELNDQPCKPKHEILLIVKMNNSEAFIMKEPISLTYYKFDDTIIGTDGIFYNFYMKNWAGWSKDAFGGRKFTLTMHDGEEVHCEGQWWDAVSPTAKMLLEGQSFVHTAANALQKLQNCYVYYGYTADKDKLAELRSVYCGPVLEYYEGEFIIKSWLKKHGKLKALITDYQGEKAAIDEHNDVYTIKVINGKTYFKYSLEVGWHGLYSEYLTEGKKDFSIKGPRKQPEYHKCKMCGCDTATIPYGNDEDYYCHICDKEMTDEDNRQNYY